MSVSQPNNESEIEFNAEYELRKNDPSIKFREYLIKDKLFWTHDWEEYFLLQEQFDYENHEYVSQVVAAIGINFVPISYLPLKEVEKYCIHIKYITTYNQYRGCGTLGTVCKFLIQAAEECGVFLHGHSRPFYIDLPYMTNQEEVKKWQEEVDSYHNPSLKADKKNAKKLLPVYLDYGFCRYDGHGVQFGNRYWKKMCFGYASSKIEDAEMSKYISGHLRC